MDSSGTSQSSISMETPGMETGESAVNDPTMATPWIQRLQAEETLYSTMSQLAVHRTALAAHLKGRIAESIRREMLHATTGYDGIQILFRHCAGNSRLDEQVECFWKELPSLESQAQAVASAAASPSATFLSASPGRPLVIKGRETMVNDLASLVTGGLRDGQGLELRSAILHGVGGIGKSTVARELLHQEAVVERFEGRRFFVRCERLTTLGDLVGRLATDLAVDTSGREPAAAVHQFVRSVATLLVLDNFEELCPATGPAAGVEDFLSALGEGSGANIVVTMRGMANLRLWRARSFHVLPLDDNAATDAFASHANRDDIDPRSDADLLALIESLDGYPLGIMLVARQFDISAGISARMLRQSYQQKHAELLRLGADPDRSTSLQISIELSFESQSMSIDGAKDLCCLLALLPDGVDDDLIESFLESRRYSLSSPAASAIRIKQAVVGAGLAASTPQHFLRMLTPLREHISTWVHWNEGIRGVTHYALAAHTSKLVALSQEFCAEDTTAESAADLRERVTIQMGNLGSTINDALRSRDLDEVDVAVRQSHHLAKFIRRSRTFVPAFLENAIAAAHAQGWLDHEIEGYFLMGRLQTHTFDFGAASASIAKALDLLDDGAFGRCDTVAAYVRSKRGRSVTQLSATAVQQGRARVLAFAGDVARLERDIEAARWVLEEALDLSRAEGDYAMEAFVHGTLGTLYIDVNDLDAAGPHLQDGARIFQEIGDRHGEANCRHQLGTYTLGYFFTSRGNDELGKAGKIHLERSAYLCHSMGDRDLEGHAHKQLGILATFMRDFETAQVHLNRSVRLLREVGNAATEATVHEKLSDLARLTNRLKDAAASVFDAWAIYKKSGSAVGLARVNRMLGRIRMLEGDLDGAELLLQESLKLNGHPINEAGQRDTRLLLQDLKMARRRVLITKAARRTWQGAVLVACLAVGGKFIFVRAT